MPIRRVEVDLEPQQEARERHEWQFEIEPFLLGGGARPREHDPSGPVRPTTVLGNVRWFWRLLHHDLAVEELRDREGRRFGGAVHHEGKWVPAASPFSLQINSFPGQPSAIPKMTEPLGYLLFSGRADPRNPAAALSEKVKGTIRIVRGRAPLDEDVLEAFKLWSLLGGVGARTRRGVGAVQVQGGPGSPDVARETIKSLLGAAAPERTANGTRGVRQVWLGTKPFRSAKDCLIALEDWYRKYRQDRRPGVPPKPGRSHWDEPEEIRKLLARRAPRHQALPPGTKHPNGWARAALGLPIVFQFKDARENDPDQSQLEGREYDRMASPLLFRPLRLAAGSYIPVVVLLSGPYEPPGGLKLKAGRQSFTVALTKDDDRVFDDLIAAGKSLSLTPVL